VGRPHVDGTPAVCNPCGVWIQAEGRFCEEPQFSYRLCHTHYKNLMKTEDGDVERSLWFSLHEMSKEQRERALAMLFDTIKRRPSWIYENPEGERQLMAEQENNENEVR
jgi:hypothetical protein